MYLFLVYEVGDEEVHGKALEIINIIPRISCPAIHKEVCCVL